MEFVRIQSAPIGWCRSILEWITRSSMRISVSIPYRNRLRIICWKWGLKSETQMTENDAHVRSSAHRSHLMQSAVKWFPRKGKKWPVERAADSNDLSLSPNSFFSRDVFAYLFSTWNICIGNDIWISMHTRNHLTTSSMQINRKCAATANNVKENNEKNESRRQRHCLLMRMTTMSRTGESCKVINFDDYILILRRKTWQADIRKINKNSRKKREKRKSKKKIPSHYRVGH